MGINETPDLSDSEIEKRLWDLFHILVKERRPHSAHVVSSAIARLMELKVIALKVEGTHND